VRKTGTQADRLTKAYRHRAVDSLTADIRGRQSWRGHLSLVSHELLDRADLRDEVEVFIDQLDIAHPSSFLRSCSPSFGTP
jgi:hypothetical protein